MKKPIIEFKDFSVHYVVQQEKTLNNINLTIHEGEKVLIIGPSGSGKSTLAHCINGLIPFSYDAEISGSLKIKGKETREMSIFEISQNVGTVLQDPDSQFVGLTVGEDIAFKLENACVSKEEMHRMVKKISKIVDIDNQLDMAPHRLSGGQKQRVTLAGSIVDDVEILLFDEPLASLDPKSGRASIELIDTIHNEKKKTVIIVEHRLEDVLHRNIDRVILINEGEIILDTTPDNLVCSELVKQNGIREPLYITALKYAGCEISPKMKPGNIKTIEIGEFKDRLFKWYDNSLLNTNKERKETLLELRNLSFSYNKDKEIIRNINLVINKGEMISIVGNNGAGKSTLSKLICGFYKPTKGQIIFKGRDIKNDTIKERAESIGMVMQNPNQMISQNMIFDEVALGLKMRGKSKEEIRERVFEALKVCGLYEYRNWPISALSYGQKKRVTIASVLVLNPDVIILDEPTAGQDFKHYTEIMEFLKELNKKGVTIIMITHDMHLMLEYTEKAIVLSDGCVLKEDTSVNILTNKEIIKDANLKETSLCELAIKLGIEKPQEFVSKFIEHDRRIRD